MDDGCSRNRIIAELQHRDSSLASRGASIKSLAGQTAGINDASMRCRTQGITGDTAGAIVIAGIIGATRRNRRDRRGTIIIWPSAATRIAAGASSAVAASVCRRKIRTSKARSADRRRRPSQTLRLAGAASAAAIIFANADITAYAGAVVGRTVIRAR